MSKFYYGSIDLTKAKGCTDKNGNALFKKVTMRDGSEHIFLNISIHEKREKGQFGDTHFVSISPKKDEQVEGMSYIVGDLKTYDPQPQNIQQQVDEAPAAEINDLPF
jgi:hypothetical protein